MDNRHRHQGTLRKHLKDVMNDLQMFWQNMMGTTKMPLNGLNFHVLLEVIFIMGLKERNCSCSDGDGVLLLYAKSGLRTSNGKNVSSK
jgi:hypothetical protein